MCALLLGTAAYVAFFRDGGRSAPAAVGAYFLDAESGRVFVASDGTSPIEAPSGGKGFRCVLYTCGSEFDPNGMDVAGITQRGGGVGYLSQYTPEAQAALEERRRGTFPDGDPRLNELMTNIRNGHQVANHDEMRWVPADSSEGYRITTAWRDACETGRPKRMRPDPRRQR